MGVGFGGGGGVRVNVNEILKFLGKYGKFKKKWGWGGSGRRGEWETGWGSGWM